jgi:molybdenum cofactor biosynthesis protein B
MSDPVAAHRRDAALQGPWAVAVLTASDRRTEANDASGAYLCEAVVAAGHRLAMYRVVREDLETLRTAIAHASLVADAVLLTGGTGPAPRDRTPEALAPFLERPLPGFGELFRWLSFQEVGGAAWLSRALAGVGGGRVYVALPGSPAAVRLAWERLLAPELPHLLAQVRRSS